MGKRICCVLLLFSLAAALFSGCGGSAVPTDAVLSEATTAAETTLPPETLPQETLPPATHMVEFDEASGLLTIRGTGDYDRLILPETADAATRLRVEDDEFGLTMDLAGLRSREPELRTALPTLIDRTEKSFRFLREYLRENAPSVYPAERTESYVELSAGVNYYGHYNTGDRIIRNCYDGMVHRDYQYLLELTGQRAGWEQLGYGWYLGVCNNPFSEVPQQIVLTEDMPYYQTCVDAGVDPTHLSLEDFRVYFDVVAAVDFQQGLNGWGSPCESRTVTVEPDYKRVTADPGDRKLSAFMAASFLAWLEERSSFETVSQFCFGKKDFSEAFGMDFSKAFEAWKSWILEQYPNV